MARVKQEVKTVEKIDLDYGLPEMEGNQRPMESAFVKNDVEDVIFPDDKRSTDFSEDSVSLYIAECSRTPLLTSTDEKILSGRMELSNYLSHVEQQLPAASSRKSRETEIIRFLISRLAVHGNLMEKLLKHYRVSGATPLSLKVNDVALREHIDDVIGEETVQFAAKATHSETEEALQDITELSIVTRLMPWRILDGYCEFKSVSELKDASAKAEFTRYLDSVNL